MSPPQQVLKKKHIISILAALLFFICASTLSKVEHRQVAQVLSLGTGCIARAAHSWSRSLTLMSKVGNLAYLVGLWKMIYNKVFLLCWIILHISKVTGHCFGERKGNISSLVEVA